MTPEREAKVRNVLNRRQSDLTVILENVFDPHNISAVMRTCDAVGIQDVYVLNTKIPRHKKFGSKSSSSALGWLSIYQFDDAEACFAAVRQSCDHIYATHLGTQSVSLYDIDFTQKTALVFGNEHAGVTDEALAFCDGNFIIPQFGMVQSLNISVACAVSLYEGLRQRERAGFYNGTCRLPAPKAKTLAEQWRLYSEVEGAPQG